METIIVDPLAQQVLWPVLAHTTHILSVAVWLGVMLFNLIIGFPMLRARAQTNQQYAQWLAEQGTRAAPWLYLLIFLTAASGGILYWLSTDPSEAQRASLGAHGFITAKVLLLALMLAAHLYATLRIWPRLIFALEQEIPRLTLAYAVTIGISTTFGIAAVLLSAYWLVLGG